MTIAYKLTTQGMTTHGGFQWKLRHWRETSGEGDLCGPGWLHAYTHPLLAVMLNPQHANIPNPRLFKVGVSGGFKDDCGLKVGYTRMRLLVELPLPEVTPTQKVAFGVLCAMEVCKDEAFHTWAKKWLSGEDRSVAAAARYAATAARYANATAARYATAANTNAAARYATAADAANATANAATAAAAARYAKPLNLSKLAKRALEVK